MSGASRSRRRRRGPVLAAQALERPGRVDRSPWPPARARRPRRAPAPVCSASSIGSSRPMIARRHTSCDRSPTDGGKPSTRAASRIPCLPLIVENVTICATWSAPYLLGRVADHLVAAALVEVHVDVGHLDALGVQEPLEQQAVAERVEVGDPQAVRHDRAGRRSPPRTDADALLAREPDEVPDDQEVAGEPHLQDDAQLEVEPVRDLRGERIAVALGGAREGQLPQVALERPLARDLEARQVVLAPRAARRPRRSARGPPSPRSRACCRTPRGAPRRAPASAPGT